MTNTNEKRPLEPRDREHIIYLLDGGYQKHEPLSMHIQVFDDFEITRAERNQLILSSDYKLDPKLVSMLTLFG